MPEPPALRLGFGSKQSDSDARRHFFGTASHRHTGPNLRTEEVHHCFLSQRLPIRYGRVRSRLPSLHRVLLVISRVLHIRRKELLVHRWARTDGWPKSSGRPLLPEHWRLNRIGQCRRGAWIHTIWRDHDILGLFIARIVFTNGSECSMTKHIEAPLALTIIGLFFIGLGVFSAVTSSNFWFTAALLGLGLVQTVYYGRRYVLQRRTRA